MSDPASPTTSKFERHFFCCLMERPAMGKPSCGRGGGVDVYNALQEALGANQELWGRVSVTTTGCMGPCASGPVIVVYPEGVWYAGVKVEDVPEIVREHMLGGRPVERLVYQWPSLD